MDAPTPSRAAQIALSEFEKEAQLIPVAEPATAVTTEEWAERTEVLRFVRNKIREGREVPQVKAIVFRVPSDLYFRLFDDHWDFMVEVLDARRWRMQRDPGGNIYLTRREFCPTKDLAKP